MPTSSTSSRRLPPEARFANVHWADPPASRIDFEQLQVQVARFDDSTWTELALARRGDANRRSWSLTPGRKSSSRPRRPCGRPPPSAAECSRASAPRSSTAGCRWNTTDEGWFGRDTYVGGSDKVSHFIISSGVSRLLYEAYTTLGHTENQSFTLAVATAFMSGMMVEIMDAFSVYGFSFQDLTADALGSAAGALINRHHLQDLLGLRLGLTETPIPASAIGSSVPTLGRSYNDEIYAADFKLGGLIRRMNGNPGFSRFFLTSFVYFTKGFGYAPRCRRATRRSVSRWA